MKKIVSICLGVTLMLSVFQVAVSASEVAPVSSHGKNITVIVPDDLSPEIRDIIFAHFYGLVTHDDNQDNIICTLFGHKLTETTTTVITHNVYSNAPRCLSEDYDLAVCSRCDYVSQELIASHRIYCH